MLRLRGSRVCAMRVARRQTCTCLKGWAARQTRLAAGRVSRGSSILGHRRLQNAGRSAQLPLLMRAHLRGGHWLWLSGRLPHLGTAIALLGRRAGQHLLPALDWGTPAADLPTSRGLSPVLSPSCASSRPQLGGRTARSSFAGLAASSHSITSPTLSQLSVHTAAPSPPVSSPPITLVPLGWQQWTADSWQSRPGDRSGRLGRSLLPWRRPNPSFRNHTSTPPRRLTGPS